MLSVVLSCPALACVCLCMCVCLSVCVCVHFLPLFLSVQFCSTLITPVATKCYFVILESIWSHRCRITDNLIYVWCKVVWTTDHSMSCSLYRCATWCRVIAKQNTFSIAMYMYLFCINLIMWWRTIAASSQYFKLIASELRKRCTESLYASLQTDNGQLGIMPRFAICLTILIDEIGFVVARRCETCFIRLVVLRLFLRIFSDCNLSVFFLYAGHRPIYACTTLWYGCLLPAVTKFV